MIRKVRRLGKEVLERWPLNVFHLAVSAIAGVEIVLEERPKIDFFKWILLLNSRDGILFGSGGGRALAVLFLLADLVEKRNRIFQLFENRVLHHLRIDHVLELELVKRKHGHHLHKPRREDLPLR